MIKLYTTQSSGKVHLVQGGYICNGAIGKVTEYGDGATDLGAYFLGERSDITCKNCLEKLN